MTIPADLLLEGLPEVETYETAVEISGLVPPDINLWPAQMQDAVFEAIEVLNKRRAHSNKHPLALAQVRINREGNRYYAHLICQTALYVGAMSQAEMDYLVRTMGKRSQDA